LGSIRFQRFHGAQPDQVGRGQLSLGWAQRFKQALDPDADFGGRLALQRLPQRRFGPEAQFF
jgi:hypothetical protein